MTDFLAPTQTPETAAAPCGTTVDHSELEILSRKMAAHFVRRFGVDHDEALGIALRTSFSAASTFDSARGVPLLEFCGFAVKRRLRALVRRTLRRSQIETAWTFLDKDGKEQDRDVMDERQVDCSIDHAEVLRALDRLPDDLRVATRLRYLEQLALREIAARQRITPEGARQRVERGIRLMRELLAANNLEKDSLLA